MAAPTIIIDSAFEDDDEGEGQWIDGDGVDESDFVDSDAEPAWERGPVGDESF